MNRIIANQEQCYKESKETNIHRTVRAHIPYSAGNFIKGNLLSTLLVSIYFYLLWQPPLHRAIFLPWYLVLGIAGLAFLILKLSLNLRYGNVFIMVMGLGFLGGVFSLFRAPDLSQALWNTVAFGINIVIYLLMLPVLATQITRRFLLFLIVIIAILWAINIQELLLTNEVLYYKTFGDASEITRASRDKNMVGYCISLGSQTLFFLTLFWQPRKNISNFRKFLVRSAFGITGLFLLYSIFLIYARSAIITVFVGVFVIALIYVIENKQKLNISYLKAFIPIVIIVVSIWFLWPKILENSPSWIKMIEQPATKGLDAYSSRTDLLLQGLEVIKQNPIIGIGIGETKASSFIIQGYKGALLHNLYLTDWLEKGILGIISYLVWIITFVRFFRKKYSQLSLVDKVWIFLQFSLFVELFFIDINTISSTMLLIFAGICYEQYYCKDVVASQEGKRKLGFPQPLK